MSAAANTIQPEIIDLPDVNAVIDDLKKQLEKLGAIKEILNKARTQVNNILLAKPKDQEQQLAPNIVSEKLGLEDAKELDKRDVTSAAELAKLESDIIARARKAKGPSLYQRFVFDEKTMEQSLEQREQQMLKTYASKGFFGVTSQLLSPRKIRTRIGLAGISEQANNYIENKLLDWTKDKEEGSKKKQFVLQIQARRSFSLEQKKKKQETVFQSAVSIVIDSTIKKIVNRIEGVVEKVKTAAMSKAASSKLGRLAINTKTNILESEFAQKGNVAVKAATTRFGKIKTGFGKGVAIVADTGKGIINITKGVGTGAIYGGIAYLAFGGNPLAGIAVGSLMGVSSLGKLILADPTLAKIPFLKNFQLKHGYGQYILKSGAWDVDALAKANIKNPIQGLGRAAKFMNAGTRWGTIGSAVGAGIALLSGAPLATGAVIGLGIGAAGGFIGDNISTRILNKTLSAGSSSRLLRTFASIPTFELLGNIQTNLWLASQIDLIIKKYKGNLGAYLKDNYFQGADDKTKLENALIISSNWLNLALGMPSVVFPTALASVSLRLGSIITGTAFKQLTASVNPVALGMAGGQLVGTLAGIATLSALGLPIGAAAIIGSTIGAFVGGTIGVIIGIVSGGSLGWITFFSAAAGSWLGTMIGGVIDKSVNKLTGLVNVLFGGISAFFHLLTIIRGQFDLDNMIMLVIALLSMFQAFDRMGVFESAYQCVDPAYCPAVSLGNPGFGTEPSILYLDHYGIGLINEVELTDEQNTNLYSYLDKSSDKLITQFTGKRIFLNLINDASYETDDLIILGLSKNNLNDEAVLSTHIDNQLANWSINSVKNTDELHLNLN